MFKIISKLFQKKEGRGTKMKDDWLLVMTCIMQVRGPETAAKTTQHALVVFKISG